MNAFDPKNDGLAPYDLVWSIGIQRELPDQMLLTASYTGNRGNRLPSQLNPINQIPTADLGKIWFGSGQPLNSAAGLASGVPVPR